MKKPTKQRQASRPRRAPRSRSHVFDDQTVAESGKSEGIEVGTDRSQWNSGKQVGNKI